MCWRAPARAPASSSTWATVCCRRRRSRRCGRWGSRCTVAEFAVLLMAYGGPSTLADVEPYLLDVRGGRPTRPEPGAEIRHRYEPIGGRPAVPPLTPGPGGGPPGRHCG